jgi:high-affinity nickel permease
MATEDVLAVLVAGFLLGLRHATDSDHVVAVATIATRERTLRGAARIGAAWGIGHTVTLLGMGGAIIAFWSSRSGSRCRWSSSSRRCSCCSER